MEAKLKFDDGIPEFCPPVESEDTIGDFYRAIEELPISRDDFLSYVSAGKASAKKNNCQHWGLSVWVSLEDALHARNINAHMKNMYISRGTLATNDGKFLATPSKKQPQHHTLWYDIEVELFKKFTIVCDPEPEEV